MVDNKTLKKENKCTETKGMKFINETVISSFIIIFEYSTEFLLVARTESALKSYSRLDRTCLVAGSYFQ
jgi:hypothetical protein